VNPTSQAKIVIAHPDSSASTSYEIGDILGEGASGITYRATNLQTQQQVALKALSLARIDDWKSLELFEREAQVLSKIDRDGIPKYIDYFHADVDGDRYFYIIQALAPGKTLQEWMKSGKRSSESEIKEIAIQILEHLIYLHRQQPPIVHRDLKPSNILKTEDGKVYLVDFGAVRQAYHDTFMRGSTVVGTFGYMAPEQFRGQAFPATDLYGLGATILSLLTHRSPAEIPLDGLRLNFRDRIQVSPHFADWLERMLEPDVSKRFSSAMQALSALKNPPKSKFKLGFSKFERTALGACGVMGLFLIFGLIYNRQYYFLHLLGLTATEPFSMIYKRADVSKIREYLDRGYDVNAKDKENYSLLNRAIYHDREDIATLLIERGADVSNAANPSESYIARIKNINGIEREHLESIGEHRNRIEQLKKESYKYYINPLISLAIEKNQVKTAALLIKKGVSIQGVYENKGYSMLHVATSFVDGGMVELLIENGANPNALDEDSCTPLHSAISRYTLGIPGQPDINVFDSQNNLSNKAIGYLIRKNADLNIRCLPFNFPYRHSGTLTPLQMIDKQHMNRPDIMNLIQKEIYLKK
jgi:ankyrin repeat protein/tRNA A-37 threonylcarbamoyl transferase component Bud32